MLDLFLYFGGNFDSVHASVSNLYWNLEVEDNVFCTLENTKTGIAASLHSTMTQWRHLFSLEVFLEKGYFVLNGLKTSSNTSNKIFEFIGFTIYPQLRFLQSSTLRCSLCPLIHIIFVS